MKLNISLIETLRSITILWLFKQYALPNWELEYSLIVEVVWELIVVAFILKLWFSGAIIGLNRFMSDFVRKQSIVTTSVTSLKPFGEVLVW